MAAVLDAFASKLTNILVGMAKEEVEMLLGVPGEITKLQTTLGDLSSILGDAERKRIRDSAAERWVRELKDVMYDADDILDLCQIMEGGKDPSSLQGAPKTSSGCWSISKMFSCFRNPAVAHEIGRKIQALNQRLEDLEKRSSRFGFITQANNSTGYSINNASSSSSNNNRKTGPSFIWSDIVGDKVEENKEELINLLIKKDGGSIGDNLFVAAAITGTGGIGKTTLARMVYNDSRVEKNFDKRIWLSVNKEADGIGLLQSVIAALGGRSYDGSVRDKALLEHALKEAVRQTKFLLVMDDVWSESEHVWSELFRVPLNDGTRGSRILVTTRNDGVARRMKARHLLRVDKLGREDAWILLKKQIVLNESDEADIDGLKDIGLKIAEKCDGLPLAVKVLGGVLLNISRTRHAWEDVCNHFTWSTEGIDDDINKAVYLSYEELPSHLKQCLVFCSLFPKDEIIRSGVIVDLWIAEGYIYSKLSLKSPEELGNEYYDELISRNLLEPDKELYGVCTMHDVVHSFAQYIIKDQGVHISEGHDINRTLMCNTKLRHLTISNKAAVNTLQKQASVRTLMLFGSNTVELKDLCNNLSLLRVLYLDNVTLGELPNSIWHLKHLRHLCLSKTSISTIPRDIEDLKFLQSLDLGGCKNVSKLPNSITKLQKLRSLNLRHTGITSVPRSFGKLEDLVCIVGFPTSNDSADGWCSLEELGPLSKLQVLDIRDLEKASSCSMAAKAMLNNKHNLKILILIFTSRLGENGEAKGDISEEEHNRTEEVLVNLCPPTCIENLDIKGYFARGLPQWMRTMSAFGNLRRLYLEDYACCTQLPNGLGQLPFLDYFWIYRAPSVQFIGHELLLPSLGDDNDGKDRASVPAGARNIMKQRHHTSHGSVVAFPKLTKLGFMGMLGWTEWEWEQHVSAMPALKELQVWNCKLQRLPPGLSYHALGLRELDLRNITNLVSIENFPSLVKLTTYDNPRIERIINNPSLQWIDISKCPALKELNGLPSLQSLEWWDLDAEAFPQYLQETKLNKLRVDCSPSLLKLIALQDDSSEWGKIKHVQQLKAYGRTSNEDEDIECHIYYTKEPCSFEVDLGESTDGEEEEENEVREEE